ncbi:hypothetical protein PIROE2DRAFT_12047, partial [Piromyces sp. E2]
MKNILKLLNLSIVYILISLIEKSYSQNSLTVNILTEKPDDIHKKDWEIRHTLISNHFKSVNVNNKLLQNVDVKFNFNSDEVMPKRNKNDYENYVKNILNELQGSFYDMIIVDGRFFFSDIAYVESGYIEETFESRKFHQFYIDLSNDIKKESLSYHQSNILKDGYINNHLYGLPYELDFDLLYYHQYNDTTVNEKLDMKLKTWNDLLKIKFNSRETNTLGISLEDDDELLNFFFEYINNQHDLSNGDIGILYSDKNVDLFNSFKQYITEYSSLRIRESLKASLDYVFESFINNESTFLKGKMSHYHYLTQNTNNSTVKATLLPFYHCILNKKYIILNKNSSIDKKILIETALQLSSKKMQLFKAENFGSVPTFDLSQKTKDSDIEMYVKANPKISDIMEKMVPLDIKGIFKGNYSAPFMEIRLLLPQHIRDYLIDDDLKSLTNVFENIKNLVMEKENNIELPINVLYIPMIIFTCFSVFVMILVHKYSNHTHIKIFSPIFCNLIIIGIVMNILSPTFIIKYHTIFKCQFRYVYETIDTCLIIFPMVAITYRIYYIYSNKSKLNIGQRLKNTYLLIIIMVSILIMTMISIGITYYSLKFYLISYGSIETYRHPTCSYEEGQIFDITELEGIKELLIYKLPSQGYFGSRLIYVIKHPQIPSQIDDSYYYDNSNYNVPNSYYLNENGKTTISNYPFSKNTNNNQYSFPKLYNFDNYNKENDYYDSENSKSKLNNENTDYINETKYSES